MNIILEDGKYTYVNDEQGQRALRYGEPWRDLAGDKFIYCMAAEIESLRQQLAECQAELQSTRLQMITDFGQYQEAHEKVKELTAEVERLKEVVIHERGVCTEYIEQRNSMYSQNAELTAQRDAAMKDAERWRLASTSRNFGIANWCEYGQRTSYDAYACQLIDAAIANCKEPGV